MVCEDFPEVIRKIPKPTYPIPVFIGPPPPFFIEAQRKVMRWTHEGGYFLPDPEWLQEPNTTGIKEVVWPYLKHLGHEDGEEISIEFLADGGLNRVYTIQAGAKSHVFRVALPVDPYYKTESDVATTELVRHFTSIPVPRIFAYDSSTDNALGLEWMFMEKITSGKSLEASWDTLDYETRSGLTRTVADWTAQLAGITSNKIGSLYLQYSEENLEFFVGRTVNNLLTQENRLLYDIFRGPFASLQEYYAAVLEVSSRDFEDVIQEYQSKSFLFEKTSSKFKGTFLDQDVFFYLGDPYEKPDEELLKERMNELGLLSKGVKTLQEALPALLKTLQNSSSSLITMLTHKDISQRNMFIDNAGAPVVLLDWENILLQPLLFLTRTPVFLDSEEEFEEPEWKDLSQREYANPEERASSIDSNEEWYVRHLKNYQCTMLRKTYRESLEHLSCPLAKAVWDDMPEFDRELKDRVLFISAQTEEHVEWVVSQLLARADVSEQESCEGIKRG